MFIESVDRTPYCYGKAENIFRRFSFSHSIGDYSTIAVTRALLFSRYHGDFSVVQTRKAYSDRDIEIFSAGIFRRCTGFNSDGSSDNKLKIIDMQIVDPSEDCFRKIANDAEEYGFVKLDDVMTFSSKVMSFLVLVNAERNIAYLFIKKLSYRRLHFALSMFPRYFPALFKDNPLSADETAMLRTLVGTSCESFLDAINKIYSSTDYESEYIKSVFKDLGRKRFSRGIKERRDRTEELVSQIAVLDEKYENYIKEYNENVMMLNTLIAESAKSNGGDEISEFVLANKCLSIDNVSDGSFDIMVKTTLSNFDPEIYRTYIKNENSAFFMDYHRDAKYSDQNEFFTPNRIILLMDAVFGTEELKIRVCSKYRLNLGTSVEGLRGFNVDDLTYTPNQHIYHYACLGDNKRIMTNAIRSEDLVGTMVACIASAQCVNLAESPTLSYFLESIFDRECGKIIEMQDKSLKTPMEAVTFLEERAAAKEAEKNAAETSEKEEVNE